MHFLHHLIFFLLMILRPPTSTLFPYTTPLPIYRDAQGQDYADQRYYTATAGRFWTPDPGRRSEEHTSELQSRFDLVCRLLLEKKKNLYYFSRGVSESHEVCLY